jgi:hypothetical protein
MLYLDGTSITDAALDDLTDIRGLNTVYFGGTRVTPAGIDRFAREAKPSLRTIGVPSEWASDPAFAALIERHPQKSFVLRRLQSENWESLDATATRAAAAV